MAASTDHRRRCDLAGKRVFIRVDFNVPLDEQAAEVTDDARIREALPTIQHAHEDAARKVILASHLGRPKGKPETAKFSLEPAGARLAELLGMERHRSPTTASATASKKLVQRPQGRAGAAPREPPLPPGGGEERRGLRARARASSATST